ncbi:MAG: hypothetical protein KBT00_02550 [Bacteroidales bacterium]|nr:hypothetical protein [Candidatus Cacconaster merdequi]
MGIRIGFFSTPQHRVFNYKPRYYDATKEHIKELEEKYSKNEDSSKEKRYIPGAAIQSAYRDGLDGMRREGGNRNLKRIIILVTLAAAMVAAYYLAQGLARMFL